MLDTCRRVVSNNFQKLPVVAAVALVIPLSLAAYLYLCFAGSHLASAVQPRIGT